MTAIWLQLLVCDTKARTEILFGKYAFNQLGCWQDYTNRIVYIKQLRVPLALKKDLTIPATMTHDIFL